MNASTIMKFYADDHLRLDGLFEKFLNLKDSDPDKAKEMLEKFVSGLEQHMAWEEAILFSEFDSRFPALGEESPTVDLSFEHEQLRDVLVVIQKKLREKDLNVEKDAARLKDLLAAHNVLEETGIYLKLDGLLTDGERAQLFQQMTDAAMF